MATWVVGYDSHQGWYMEKDGVIVQVEAWHDNTVSHEQATVAFGKSLDNAAEALAVAVEALTRVEAWQFMPAYDYEQKYGQELARPEDENYNDPGIEQALIARSALARIVEPQK